MKTHLLANAPFSGHGVKLVALVGVMTALLGAPGPVWSSSTLLSDSYATSPFAGVKHGSEPALLISGINTGYLKFSLSNSLPTGVTDTDIDKATLKIFMAAVKTPGHLTIRQAIQGWREPSLPADGISPALDLVTPAKTFAIKKAYARHWVEFDVTDIVKG